MDPTERLIASLCVGSFLVLAATASRTPDVEIRLSPRFGTAPQDLRVTIAIRDSEMSNARIVDWVLDCDTGYYSRRSYEVASQPLPTYQMTLPKVPAGRCQAVAWLTRADASTVRSRIADVCISGVNLSCAGE